MGVRSLAARRIVLSIGWQLAAAPPIPGATQSRMTKIMPFVMIVIGLFLLWYSWNAEKKGVLR